MYPADAYQRQMLDEEPVRQAYRAARNLLQTGLLLSSHMKCPAPVPPERTVYYTDTTARVTRPARPEELSQQRRDRDRRIADLLKWAAELVVEVRVLEQMIRPLWDVLYSREHRTQVLVWRRFEAFVVADDCALRGALTFAQELVGIVTSSADAFVREWMSVHSPVPLPADFRAQLLTSLDRAWRDASLGGASAWDELPSKADVQGFELLLRDEEERVLEAWRKRPHVVEYEHKARSIRYDANTRTVLIDSKQALITDECAAKYFQLVIEAQGAFVSGAVVRNDLGNTANRLSAKLPPEVYDLIERVPSKGTRMKQ
jgi:hypothetical protein